MKLTTAMLLAIACVVGATSHVTGQPLRPPPPGRALSKCNRCMRECKVAFVKCRTQRLPDCGTNNMLCTDLCKVQSFCKK